MDKIDFVIPWVDGSDPQWIKEKSKFDQERHKAKIEDSSNAACRYRGDSDMLRYWFRGVEKCAPWVNTIHFVTCGQKPEWLNENHPRLHLVNHSDYIPAKYLPTFNSNTIELNYHRIEDLAEKFVLFNDDCYLLKPVNPEFFFNTDPVLSTNLNYNRNIEYSNWCRVMFNDYCVVNTSFDIKSSIKSNWRKWFNVKELGLGRSLLNYLCFKVNCSLPVSSYGHYALPHLKSTLQEVWERHPDIMDQSCLHKFRSDDQVNQWLLCAWNQAKGTFFPGKRKRLGVRIVLAPDTLPLILEIIKDRSLPQICINDTASNTEPDKCMAEIMEAFKMVFPEKSMFEKC